MVCISFHEKSFYHRIPAAFLGLTITSQQIPLLSIYHNIPPVVSIPSQRRALDETMGCMAILLARLLGE